MRDPSPYSRPFAATVIITVYQQPDTLRLTLEALARQSASGFEIIVTDDGSTPAIAELVTRFASSVSFPVRYVWQQDQLFRAGQARNNAIRLANGEILILLDGDSVPPHDFVQRHLDAHRDKKRLILAGGRQFCRQEDLASSLALEDPRTREDHLTLASWTNTQEETYRSGWLKSDNPWKAGFSYNMSVRFTPKFYFDENFLGWGIEDWEVFYRLWKQGYEFQYAPALSVWHFEVPDLIWNVFRLSDHDGMVRFAHNALYFLDKYPDDPSLRECTIAFRCYELGANNRWFWDTTKNYSVEEGITRLRDWLSKN